MNEFTREEIQDNIIFLQAEIERLRSVERVAIIALHKRYDEIVHVHMEDILALQALLEKLDD
jgi:hypothetical protein